MLYGEKPNVKEIKERGLILPESVPVSNETK